jgi:alanine-glyoxylate transaminase / serine-glyoxylate transaminase / serine-pyruvate transaminase
MTVTVSALNPPQRLLCGPGPSNVLPAALDAMERPMIGHLDPDLHEILSEVVALLRGAYQASDGVVMALPATGTSGMEAGLTNLLEPGDEAIVGVSGFFGRRIAEIAQRCGATVVEVEADWGEHVPNEQLLAALERHPNARLMAVVHAETSTGVQHPLAELGAAVRDHQVLLMADCVTSLGGVPLDFDGWGLDYAYSCTQKCLGAPPGMSPIAISDRAMERIRSRTAPVPFSLDLLLLERYWLQRPAVYHHTAPILHIYALHEALRSLMEEGLEERWARHAAVGGFMQEEIRGRGFDLLADPDYQLAPLTAVRVPEGMDGKRVQLRMLREHDIEIGGGLGPAAPAMWRIGLMGHNASRGVAQAVLMAFDKVLADEPVPQAAVAS